jgi:hypothetical protein
MDNKSPEPVKDKQRRIMWGEVWRVVRVIGANALFFFFAYLAVEESHGMNIFLALFFLAGLGLGNIALNCAINDKAYEAMKRILFD